jgi:pilus assembly protein Flp/PilA
MITKLLKDESGATAIEYGLIAGLIAVAAIAAMTFAGDQIRNMFNAVGSELQKAQQKGGVAK